MRGWLKNRVLDDRGRPAPAFSPGGALADESDRAEDPELAEIAQRLAAVTARHFELKRRLGALEVTAGLVYLGLFSGLGGFIGLVYVVPLISFRGLFTPWGILGAAAYALMLGVSTGLLLRAIGRCQSRDTILATLLSQGRCGSCGYRLPSDSAPDGCRVCPECGAAWRSGRVGRGREMGAAPGRRWDSALGRGGAMSQMPVLTDVRGVALRLVDPWRAGVLEARLGADRAAGLRRILRRTTRRERWVLTAMTGTFFALIVWTAGGYLGTGNRWASVAVPVFMVGFLAILVANAWRNWSGRSWASAEMIRSVLLAHHICPACGGDFGGAERAGEHIVCPGCDAAWPRW